MLRNWLETEREKLHTMDRAKAAEYIWQYYKLWIISVVGAVCIGAYLLILSLSTPNENWLYVCFANVLPGSVVEEEGEVHQAYADYAGFDLREKNLVFDTNCYCNPSEKTYGNNYYNKLIALMDGGVLDLLIMEKEDLQAIGSTGRLLDLEGEYFLLDQHWKDRLIYCENTASDYEKSLVPVAVDLTGSFLTEAEGPYPEGCAVSLSAFSSRPEELERFLIFFLEEGNP